MPSAAVTPRGQETIDKILDSTLVFIAREGFAKLTTNHIAKESGVKVGSMYRFFPNKEAILTALIERWFESIRSTIQRYVDVQPEDTHFPDIVRGLFLENLKVEYQDSEAYQEIQYGASTLPFLHDVFLHHQKKVVDYIASIYPNPRKRNRADVIEFCTFLHNTTSNSLAIVAPLKPRSQARHIEWTLAMLDAAIITFEEAER